MSAPSADQETIRKYMAGQEALDVDQIMEHIADDAVLEFPYALPGMAATVAGGADVLREHLGQLPHFLKSFSYSETTIEPLAAEGRYLVETKVDAELLAEGAPAYENRYAVVVEVAGGKVVLWREYFGATEIGGLLASMAGA